MKRAMSLLLCALLCLAMLGGCGGEAIVPVGVSTSVPTETEAATERATTAQETTSPAATEAPTSTTKRASIPTAAATTHSKDVDRPWKSLSYNLDENGIFYLEEPSWQMHPQDIWLTQSQPLNNSPAITVMYSIIRVKFQYDQKDWLIQLRKGSHNVVLLGGEICVAAKPATQDAERYYLAGTEIRLVYKMDVYQMDFQNKSIKKLFTRGPEDRWFTFNGFAPGDFHQPGRTDEIIVVGSITFPNEEMLRAFEGPFAAAGFEMGRPGSRNPEKYSISGTTLSFSWQYIDQDA